MIEETDSKPPEDGLTIMGNREGTEGGDDPLTEDTRSSGKDKKSQTGNKCLPVLL
jgi:hypothetical protein